MAKEDKKDESSFLYVAGAFAAVAGALIYKSYQCKSKQAGGGGAERAPGRERRERFLPPPADNVTTAEEAWKAELRYVQGIGDGLRSEVLPNAIPVTNTPQRCPYGLYAEQLTGSSFTAPRVENFRSWLYRIQPCVMMGKLKKVDKGRIVNDFTNEKIYPQRLRMNPIPMPKEKTDFIQGMHTIAGSGNVESKVGLAVHWYVCNTSMTDRAFDNSDGDMLIVPQEGELLIRTEFGWMRVGPGEICVIQRSIRWQVNVEGPCRGYICEVYEGHFKIPDLGPIGGNGLAQPRDFVSPTASYEHTDRPHTIVQKFLGELFEAPLSHSPFNVVGWHGNLVPFKYDLSKYCVVNSVSREHLDPSIFVVLAAYTPIPGTAVCDFVVFPPRWSVHTETFRPPYFHRNKMCELMGNIRGKYEAKQGGFLPGAVSLHSCGIPHGPDTECFEGASRAPQVPVPPKEEALAFMFESHYQLKLTTWAKESGLIQKDYCSHWQGLKDHFTPDDPAGRWDD